MARPLECPGCGARGAASERFCPRCGSPFVLAAGAVPLADAARERARKVHPPFAEGPLVRVARAANQAEAELIAGLLLEAGVPSLARRAGGFDVPDFLAAGPRDVLVPEGGAAAARAVLGAPVPGVDGDAGPSPPVARAAPWTRVLAFVLAVLILAAFAAAVLSTLL